MCFSAEFSFKIENLLKTKYTNRTTLIGIGPPYGSGGPHYGWEGSQNSGYLVKKPLD